MSLSHGAIPSLAEMQQMERHDPFPDATELVELFHLEEIIPIHFFDLDPRHVDARLLQIELNVVRAMWTKGYLPSKPMWEMWVEREPFGFNCDSQWRAHVRVTIQGVHRVAL